ARTPPAGAGAPRPPRRGRPRAGRPRRGRGAGPRPERQRGRDGDDRHDRDALAGPEIGRAGGLAATGRGKAQLTGLPIREAPPTRAAPGNGCDDARERKEALMKARLWHYGSLLLSSFILFITVITVLFFLLELAPGDPVQALVGDVPLTEEFRQQLIAAYGLDRPAWERYLVYLGNVLTGNLGYSFATNAEPVLDIILSRVGTTLALAVPAFVLSTAGGIVLGSIAARTRRRWLDAGISGFTVGLFSIPNFWLGMLLIIVFSITLGWFPTGGKSPYGQPGISLEHMVLPIITMATSELAYKARIMRSSMIESLGQDFIDTARSKGLSSRRLVFRHALPNALLPMITVSGYSL